ncbi:hypothetical protein AAFF27_00380 [Xylophilus sp. GW821-FHT01B05]
MTISHPRYSLAQSLADEIVSSLDGAFSVHFATIDGFDVARACRRNLDASRVAAMTSSLVALSCELGRSCDIGDTQGVVLESSGGYVVARAIPVFGGDLVMTVVTDRSALLGMVRLQVSEAARRFADAA